MSVYLGKLGKLTKKIGVHIFNTLKIKKINVNADYKDWETAEKHQNLIHQIKVEVPMKSEVLVEIKLKDVI
jgi:hypothetical protein